MRKIYWTKCKKYKQIKKPKIWYICNKTFLPSICNKCGSEGEKIFKAKESSIKNFWFNSKYIITLKIWVKTLH